MLEVWTDVFTDGHEKINACLRYRVQGEDKWREEPLTFFDNDRWVGRIPLYVERQVLLHDRRLA